MLEWKKRQKQLLIKAVQQRELQVPEEYSQLKAEQQQPERRWQPDRDWLELLEGHLKKRRHQD